MREILAGEPTRELLPVHACGHVSLGCGALSRFWERWDGRPDDPAGVFAPLAAHLERRSAGRPPV